MKWLLIFIGLILLMSCKETIIEDNCYQDRTISWDYVNPGHKVGFKIYCGETNPDTVIATINPSTPPVTKHKYTFNMCASNYIGIAAFDDVGNESVFGPVVCVGTNCRPYAKNNNLGTSKEKPPKMSLGLTIE
jgi:hypothetical protein